MSISSEILARRLRLVRPRTHDVVCEGGLRVPMDDGVTLLADRWVARADRDAEQPTVLVRSPYGRKGVVGLLLGRLLAERGLQVVLQSTRGTFGSGGEFNPFDERADGLATLRWIRAQPWHRERFGMLGPSYLGVVQWAVAADAGDDLAALAIDVSASQVHGQVFAGETLALETTASWLALVSHQERPLAIVAMARALRALPSVLSELPLAELDVRATGARAAWFRDALDLPDGDGSYWSTRDFSAGVGRVTAPVQLIGGWYDIFLPWMLVDYAALRAAGRRPQLVIGPWTHTAPGLTAASMRENIAWLRANLLDDPRLVNPAAVRVYVTGERSGGGWRELADWPAPGSGERTLWLGEHGDLRESAPNAPSEPDRYVYDPADPTPSLGGPVLLARRPVVDNRPLEARPDVVTYSTATLESTVEAVGPVRVAIWVRASSEFFDLFARVCDVDASGISRNVSDALARVRPGDRFERAEDGSVRVAFDLWPIAHRFAAGHRIRLLISSGAHPRYARNPGTGEELAHATRLQAVSIEILHDAEHPSALVLPGD